MSSVGHDAELVALWIGHDGPMETVDFVIGDHIAIEVKGKPRVTRRDMNGLRALAEELPLERKIVVCTEPRRRTDDDVEILPIESFLQDLWAGKIC